MGLLSWISQQFNQAPCVYYKNIHPVCVINILKVPENRKYLHAAALLPTYNNISSTMFQYIPSIGVGTICWAKWHKMHGWPTCWVEYTVFVYYRTFQNITSLWYLSAYIGIWTHIPYGKQGPWPYIMNTITIGLIISVLTKLISLE